jgi:hypothetical protein
MTAAEDTDTDKPCFEHVTFFRRLRRRILSTRQGVWKKRQYRLPLFEDTGPVSSFTSLPDSIDVNRDEDANALRIGAEIHDIRS